MNNNEINLTIAFREYTNLHQLAHHGNAYDSILRTVANTHWAVGSLGVNNRKINILSLARKLYPSLCFGVYFARPLRPSLNDVLFSILFFSL